MLTKQKLMDMQNNNIFALGEIEHKKYPNLIADTEIIRWIAIRGDFYDWAIYYDDYDKTIEEIAKKGRKCISQNLIRTLVFCDEEAFKLYRF
jgi:hypothetical protein